MIPLASISGSLTSEQRIYWLSMDFKLGSRLPVFQKTLRKSIVELLTGNLTYLYLLLNA